MENLVYVTKIGDTELTGLIDVTTQKVYCFCPKEVAEEILKNRKNTSITENKIDYSILEEVDFFDLMQSYRITDQSNQENVINRFNSVKEFIKDNFVPKKSEEILENKTKIEWREQNTKFGLDYSTKTGKWEDYTFDIRYDYDGNPDEKPSKCSLHVTIMKKDKIIERERSYIIEDLVTFSNIYMLDEQRKFLKGKFN